MGALRLLVIWLAVCLVGVFMSYQPLRWMELPWLENPANTYARHSETLDSCFDLIRTHQQCIPLSPPLEIEPATTDCRAESLQLSISPYRTHKWLSCRDSALQSVVAGSSSSGGDHGIHCWWVQIDRNSCPVISYVVHRCSSDFLVMVIQFTI